MEILVWLWLGREHGMIADEFTLEGKLICGKIKSFLMGYMSERRQKEKYFIKKKKVFFISAFICQKKWS